MACRRHRHHSANAVVFVVARLRTNLARTSGSRHEIATASLRIEMQSGRTILHGVQTVEAQMIARTAASHRQLNNATGWAVERRRRHCRWLHHCRCCLRRRCRFRRRRRNGPTVLTVECDQRDNQESHHAVRKPSAHCSQSLLAIGE